MVIKLFRKLRDTRRLLIRQSSEIAALNHRLEDIQLSLGRVEAHLSKGNSISKPWDFQVFSQWNEDGILQWILAHTEIKQRSFIEFGVEDYLESNTRFLLRKDFWSGLVIDADAAALARLNADSPTWKYGLRVVNAFITRDNINQLIRETNFSGDIGLLSIDLDGNDYWIWNAIDVVNPRVVITEFNGFFPSEWSVSIPYSETFSRRDAHPSLAYWGASLAAFDHLAGQRGYALVAINNAGSNAFFVRKDVLKLPSYSAQQLYHYPCFREARDQHGKLLDLNQRQLLELIAELEVVDVTNARVTTIGTMLTTYQND